MYNKVIRSDILNIFTLSALFFFITCLLLIACFPIRQGLNLLGYFAYMTISTTFIPLPTPQMVIYYGINYGETFSPFLIALVGGIGSCIGCMIDYTLLSYAVEYASKKSEKFVRLKAARTYRYTARVFNKVAFLSLVLAAFTILPFEPVKFLAIVTRYNRLKYIFSIFIGRVPRYFILAKIGHDFLPAKYNLYINILLFGSIFLMLLLILVKRITKIIESRQNSKSSEKH